MYDKILAQLKQKYSGVSKRALEVIAKKLASKTTEESAIEGAITEFDNLFGVQDFANALQSEGDLRVTEAAKKPKTEEQQQQQQQQQKLDDEMPAWAKKLNEKIDTLSTQRQRDTLQETLHKKLTEKKIPLSMAKRVVLEKEEDIDALVTEIETDYNSLVQTSTDERTKENMVTVVGGNKKAEAVDAEIAAWSKQNQPAQKEAGK